MTTEAEEPKPEKVKTTVEIPYELYWHFQQMATQRHMSHRAAVLDAFNRWIYGDFKRNKKITTKISAITDFVVLNTSNEVDPEWVELIRTVIAPEMADALWHLMNALISAGVALGKDSEISEQAARKITPGLRGITADSGIKEQIKKRIKAPRHVRDDRAEGSGTNGSEDKLTK